MIYGINVLYDNEKGTIEAFIEILTESWDIELFNIFFSLQYYVLKVLYFGFEKVF